jgi:hypothetical protein
MSDIPRKKTLGELRSEAISKLERRGYDVRGKTPAQIRLGRVLIKRVWGAAVIPMSALPPKADMCGATRYVRFGPKADMWLKSNDHSL